MMNELENLKGLWQQQEQKLEQTMALNLDLLQEVKIINAKNHLRSLIWISGITLMFYMVAFWYFVSFTVQNLENWHFVISGAILMIWSAVIAIGAMLQLKSLLSLDYSKPVADMQKQLQQIKFTVIRFLRFSLMILPFYVVFPEVIFKVFFNADFVAMMDPIWIIVQTIVLIPVAVWLYFTISPKNADKKWMNWLLQGQGSQIKSAQEFILEIDQLQSGK